MPQKTLIQEFHSSVNIGHLDRALRLLAQITRSIQNGETNPAEAEKIVGRCTMMVDQRCHKATDAIALKHLMTQITEEFTDFFEAMLAKGFCFPQGQGQNLLRLNLAFNFGTSAQTARYRKAFWGAVNSGQVALPDSERSKGLARASFKKPKVAVIIAGQMRAWKQAAKSLPRFLEGTDYTTFLATWDQTGYRPAAHSKFKDMNLQYYKMVLEEKFAVHLSDNGIDLSDILPLLPSVANQLVTTVNAEQVKLDFSAYDVAIHNEEAFNAEFGELADKLVASFPAQLAETSVALPLNMLKLVYLREKANELSINHVKQSGSGFDFKIFLRPDYIHSDHFPVIEIINEYALRHDEILIDAMHPEHLLIYSDCFAFGQANAMDRYFDQWKNFIDPDFSAGKISCPVKPHDRLAEHLWMEGLSVRYITGVRSHRDEHERVTDQEVVHQLTTSLADTQLVSQISNADHIESLRTFVLEMNHQHKGSS